MDNRLLSSPDLSLRTRWYIGVRWLYLAAIVGPGVLSLYIGEGWSQQVQRDALLGFLAIASNGVFYLLSKKLATTSAYRFLAISLLIIDIALITYLIYTKGGVESRSPILYTIPILMSAAILGQRAIYVIAVTAVVTYDSIILADFFGIIRSIGSVNPGLRTEFPYVLNTVTFFTSILLVIAMSADFITRLLRDKEKQATESLENLNRAQAIAKFGSWTWDLTSQHIAWSRELYDIFDIDKKTIIQPSTFYDRIHPSDHAAVKTTIAKAVKNRKGFSFNFRVVTAKGIRHVHSDGQVIADASKHATQVIGTARDITEEKLLESAKNEFVALASHQLRTPSTVVKQYLSMLLDGYAGQLLPSQKQFVEVANKNNERQLATINDLLNVAQIDSGKMKLHPEKIELVDFLNDVVIEQSIHVAEKHQSIRLMTRHKKIVCEADKHRLRMALENIIENAHKYSPEHKPIVLRLSRSQQKVHIAIEDHGVGIAKHDMPKIFQKFSRIESPASLAEDGTGLGLYWVEKVIKLHGGKITVKSKLHAGTTFTISLPL